VASSKPLAGPAATAITRTDLSLPARLVLREGYLGAPAEQLRILDFGAGKGGDVRRLWKEGYNIVGWDPLFPRFNNEKRLKPARVVTGTVPYTCGPYKVMTLEVTV